MLRIPDGAALVMRRLREAGFRAYAVGGCVRDALLAREPKDWDLCTDALPEEMQRVFAGDRVVLTGLKHGTLTVVVDRVPYEVTTFRVDGAYSDHRHPDSVVFVDDVAQDLSRRDFTVNAMAWSPESGLVDLFHGRDDLQAGIIRCVGEPEKRFSEDALRILRALRFASAYGFSIDPQTALAARKLRGTLDGVAGERVRAELAKLLCGPGCGRILRAFPDVIGQVLPETVPMQGFQQRNRHHRYDVWEHSLRATEAVPPTETLRLTMLLHDCGKPACFTLDERGVGHAYGHQALSAEMAARALERLRMDRATADRVTLLIARHDLMMTTEPALMRKRLQQLGEEVFRQLIEVQRADALGKGTVPRQEAEDGAAAMRSALDALLATRPCVTLRDLAVNGRDLLAAGIAPGPAVGRTLASLLADVVAQRLPNDRDALLRAAQAGTEPQAD